MTLKSTCCPGISRWPDTFPSGEVCHTDRVGEGKQQGIPSQVIVDDIEGDKVRVEIDPGLTADWDKASLA